MSIQALSHYTFYARYARYNSQLQRRETWTEAVGRVYDMHRTKYAERIDQTPELAELINFAESMQRKKRVLASQRSLQFAGDPIFKHELKMYNCLTSHINRERAFSEIMYALLCGCGVGFSVQKHHIKQLPRLASEARQQKKKFVIEDSIEGWADAVGVLMSSFLDDPKEFVDYANTVPVFDYSEIRPEGSLIAGQFKAPGPDGLELALNRVRSILIKRISSPEFKTDEFAYSLRPIDAYDIVMHIADAVLSGGVRRSATICMFSHDDLEMLNAKIGNWFMTHPQRGRSNNSAVLLKGSVTRAEFSLLMESTKEFGEPGFIWVDDLEILYNPCAEIGMIPTTEDGRSGFQGCNLTEMSGKWCDTKEKFFEACVASAIIGTLQAGYTNFKYLSKESIEIFKREALLGCSITGLMDNPEILLDPEIQKEGAKLVLETNKKVAKMLGINPCARATCVKPAGSTSCVLGTSSGIHPHHAKRYIRRVQANKTEFCLNVMQEANPLAVEESVWSASKTDKVISFLCEVPAGAITKNQVGAIDLLKKVRLTQKNWVEHGTNKKNSINPKIRHNVSNTINVLPDEWDEVEKFIFDNQRWFAGVSLLSASGDLDYAQAPFSAVLTPSELVREYGDASVFASGLIVDGLKAFDDNLWQACDIALGINQLPDCGTEPEYPKTRNYKDLAEYFAARELYENCIAKEDWIRRIVQFSKRYFNDDIRRTTYCLKHTSLWKTWCDLQREYKEIDWSVIKEENEEYIDADTMGAQACSGGQCEIL